MQENGKDERFMDENRIFGFIVAMQDWNRVNPRMDSLSALRSRNTSDSKCTSEEHLFVNPATACKRTAQDWPLHDLPLATSYSRLHRPASLQRY